MIETVTAVMGLVSVAFFWPMHLKVIVPELEFEAFGLGSSLGLRRRITSSEPGDS